MVIIAVAPPVAPPVPEKQWESITCEWVGADGSVWNLADGTQGVVLQAAGTEGMHDPILTRHKSRASRVPGARITGWRAEERPVFWPLRIFADTSARWRDTYARFFASIHPEIPGTWRVGFAGEIRELDVTGTYTRSHPFDRHPTVQGWGNIGVPLEAVDPYWRGTPQTGGPWRSSEPVDFFGEDGAPDFHISETEGFGSATVTNPGDVPAYLTWTIDAFDAPLPDVQVGAGGRVVTVPFSVPAGKRLLIDTDPRNLTARLGDVPTDDDEFQGESVTSSLGFRTFAPLEPGEERPVTVAANGAGEISCSLTPLHFRAI